MAVITILEEAGADDMLNALVGHYSETGGGTDQNGTVALHTVQTGFSSSNAVTSNGISTQTIDPDDWTISTVTVSGIQYRRIANTNEVNFGDPTAEIDIDAGSGVFHAGTTIGSNTARFHGRLSITNPTATTSKVYIAAGNLYYQVALQYDDGN